MDGAAIAVCAHSMHNAPSHVGVRVFDERQKQRDCARIVQMPESDSDSLNDVRVCFAFEGSRKAFEPFIWECRFPWPKLAKNVGPELTLFRLSTCAEPFGGFKHFARCAKVKDCN